MKTKKGFTLRSLGNEYILVADGLEVVDFNRMVSMNDSAALLWKEIDGKEFDADTLADILVDNYAISRETAQRDVALLLQSWQKAGIVE